MNDTPTSGTPQTLSQRAEERHQRSARDYLKPLMQSAHYIDNVSILLAAAAEEMQNSTFGKEGHTILAATASERLHTLLHRTRILFRNERQLDSAEMSGIANVANNVASARKSLGAIAGRRANDDSGLSEETIVAARAALDVFDNKLGRIAAAPGLVESLRDYNASYTERMAEAQRSHKTGRIEGHKERLAEELKTHITRSAKSETRRTGIASFRQAAIEQKNKEQAPETVR